MRRLTWVRVILGVIVTVPVWVATVGAGETRAVERVVQAAIAGRSAEDLRPVLRGTAEAGRAREAYQRALAEMERQRIVPYSLRLLQQKWIEEGPSQLLAVQACIARAETAFAALAEGARRSDAGRELAVELGTASQDFIDVDLTALTELVGLSVLERHAVGDEQGLSDRLCDGLQFAGDLFRSPSLTEELKGAFNLLALCDLLRFGEASDAFQAGLSLDAWSLRIETREALAQKIRILLGGFPRTTRAMECGALGFWLEAERHRAERPLVYCCPLLDPERGLATVESQNARCVMEQLAVSAALTAAMADRKADEFEVLRELQEQRDPARDRLFGPAGAGYEGLLKVRQQAILRLWLLASALEFGEAEESATWPLPYGLGAEVQRGAGGGFEIALLSEKGEVPEHLQEAVVRFAK